MSRWMLAAPEIGIRGRRCGWKQGFVAVFLVVIGCVSHTVTIPPVERGTVTATSKDRIRVMECADGVFGSTTYLGSGRQVADSVLQALKTAYGDVAMVASTNEDVALKVARRDGARFLIEPTIVLWEDRKHMWSKTADRVHVRVVLRDVATNAVLDSISFEARRRFSIWRNPPPGALLDDTFDRAVLGLLRQ